MNKVLRIAQREYIATVKTKAFFLGVFVGPIFIGAILFFAGRVDKIGLGDREAVTVGVTDLTGELSGQLEAAFRQHSENNPDKKIIMREYAPTNDVNSFYQSGKKALRERVIEAYFVVEKGVIAGQGSVLEYTYRTKPGDVDVIWKCQSIMKNVIVDERCRQRNLSRDEVNALWRLNFDSIVIGETISDEKKADKDDFVVTMMMPFAMMFLIYIGIILIGQHILSSVIEEKNSRIIEVLLSAVSPIELMAGKILGLVCAGMTVMAIWCLMALSLGSFKGFELNLSFYFVLIFIVYYVLGFLFFSALMAGIGSLCNTIKESQSLMTPLVMILIIPMISWYELAKNPNGLFARVLSMVPPVSPLVMVLRLSSSNEIPVYEIILSLIFLMVGVIFAFWLAGKVFKTGILMYGKKPKIKEVIRWLRER
ncbi:MAG: ABC transporter permease [Sedimentisphaerales bacterium]|nr:ABC transporter permease [Sedimentisphaerales bacterium]